MTAYVGWRIAKFVGLALFGAGCLGGALVEDRNDRARLALGASTVGWLVTWIAGYGMVKGLDLKISEPWITAAMGFSFLALLGSVASAQGAWRWLWSGLAVGGMVASVAVMGLRTAPMAHAWASGAGLLGGVFTAAWVSTRETSDEGASLEHVRTWFDWIGRLEGLSLLALFGIFMPFKYALHIELDGGQGWFGWVHGMLFIAYLVALVSAVRSARWSIGRAVLGFVASLVPFGTFVFEARMKDAWRT